MFFDEIMRCRFWVNLIDHACYGNFLENLIHTTVYYLAVAMSYLRYQNYVMSICFAQNN